LTANDVTGPAGAVVEEPAAPEAHCIRSIRWRRRDDVVSLVDDVGAGEMAGEVKTLATAAGSPTAREPVAPADGFKVSSASRIVRKEALELGQ
jgi:hypothetical protein